MVLVRFANSGFCDTHSTQQNTQNELKSNKQKCKIKKKKNRDRVAHVNLTARCNRLFNNDGLDVICIWFCLLYSVYFICNFCSHSVRMSERVCSVDMLNVFVVAMTKRLPHYSSCAWYGIESIIVICCCCSLLVYCVWYEVLFCFSFGEAKSTASVD